VIFGLQLKAGDEVVAARQDYPNMINAYKQRGIRDGIKMVWINLELPSEDEDYLVKQYRTNAFTPKNKSGAHHPYHQLEWAEITGEEDCRGSSHKRGIEVVVDGAHSFAHFDFIST
jgi:selenocysteine lyase/cysteine desulfurase